jgi:hypothetical protein
VRFPDVGRLALHEDLIAEQDDSVAAVDGV